LWDYPKISTGIGCKEIFKEAGDVSWLKRLWWKLVELHDVVGSKGR